MRFLKETQKMIVFVSFFSIAVLILIGVPINKSVAKKVEIPDVGSVDFGTPADSTDIDNIYMPLIPGTTFYYEAETADGLETNTVEVTHDTKVILGITTVVVRDKAFLDGVLIEDTFDWFAQDVDDNVWYFGEATKTLDSDGNVLSTEGSWEAGADVAGTGDVAKAGIVMLANPKQGLSYMQEFYKDVAEDMASVLRLNAKVSIELGDFDNCLKTKEWSPLERGSIENKYYYPGVGLVYVEELKGKTVKVELVDITP